MLVKMIQKACLKALLYSLHIVLFVSATDLSSHVTVPQVHHYKRIMFQSGESQGEEEVGTQAEQRERRNEEETAW